MVREWENGIWGWGTLKPGNGDLEVEKGLGRGVWDCKCTACHVGCV